MIYEDLLTVPFKEFGRTMDGLDCYGLCIELCKRAGKTLNDITDKKIETIRKINVLVIQKKDIEAGDLVHYEHEDGELHIGYLLDKTNVIHMTKKGVRITPLIYFSNVEYLRVV